MSAPRAKGKRKMAASAASAAPRRRGFFAPDISQAQKFFFDALHALAARNRPGDSVGS
jgi:hypothetical protein